MFFFRWIARSLARWRQVDRLQQVKQWHTRMDAQPGGLELEPRRVLSAAPIVSHVAARQPAEIVVDAGKFSSQGHPQTIVLSRSAAGDVVSVNGQVPDGEDLSWLWDVLFEQFGDERLARRASGHATSVVAAGERGTDLAVRLGYAGVEHSLVHDTMAAVESCPPGHVEVVANYTAFLQLQRALERRSHG